LHVIALLLVGNENLIVSNESGLICKVWMIVSCLSVLVYFMLIEGITSELVRT